MKNLWLVIILFIAGCAGKAAVTHPPTLEGVSQTAQVDAKTGNLIALWMNNVEGQKTPQQEAVLVPSPYAMFISWPNPEYVVQAEQKHVFIMYDNVAKKCWQTRDYRQFLQVVAQQPKDITIDRLDTCTVSQCYLPEKELKELAEVMATRNIHWGEESRIFCTCKSDGVLIYPGDRKP